MLFGTNIVFGQEAIKAHKLNKKQALNIVADKVEIIRDKNKIIFTDNVKAVQDIFELFADKMEVFYKEDENDKISIQTITAKNNVRFNTDKIFAKGDEGRYDVINKKIKLIKNVTATEGGITVFAQEFEYDILTEKTKILGDKKSKERVTIILEDLKDISPKGGSK